MITVDFQQISIRPGDAVLDIGCGSGRHTCAVYGLEKVSVVGTDIHLKNLAEAGKRLTFHEQIGAHGGGRWALSAADATRLPFRDDSFDLVICSEVLEHIPNHRQAVKEAVRVLKPGKDLVVSVPRYWPEKLCWYLSTVYGNEPGGHIRIYKSSELKALLEKWGLQIRKRRHAHSLHVPYWWLKCITGLHRNDSLPVNLYHRFLVWEMMKKPPMIGWISRLLDPVMGKSLVLYAKKPASSYPRHHQS